LGRELDAIRGQSEKEVCSRTTDGTPDAVQASPLRALDRAAAHRVGVAVDLTAALKADGTQHYGPDYNEAVEFLIDEGAIEEDPQTAPIGSGEHPRGHLYWAITVKGRALLRALT
jgi:hypothetical protein